MSVVGLFCHHYYGRIIFKLLCNNYSNALRKGKSSPVHPMSDSRGGRREGLPWDWWRTKKEYRWMDGHSCKTVKRFFKIVYFKQNCCRSTQLWYNSAFRDMAWPIFWIYDIAFVHKYPLWAQSIGKWMKWKRNETLHQTNRISSTLPTLETIYKVAQPVSNI